MVSCYGQVLSLLEANPLVLKQSSDSKGYLVVNISGKVRRVHRLVASAFLGLNITDSKTVVLHRDDNPLNNNVANLAIGTQLDNIRDMFSKGRRRRPDLKLTDDDVRTIRERIKRGERGKHLAKEYGVSGGIISGIKNGKYRSDAA